MGGAKKKKHLPIHTLFMKLDLLPRFGPIPPNLCRSLPALPLVVGWESLSGHWGVTGESPATGCYNWGCQVGLLNSSRTFFPHSAAANHTPKIWELAIFFKEPSSASWKFICTSHFPKKRGKSILRLALYFCNSMLEFTSDLFDFHYFCRRQVCLISIPVCGYHLLLS